MTFKFKPGDILCLKQVPKSARRKVLSIHTKVLDEEENEENFYTLKSLEVTDNGRELNLSRTYVEGEYELFEILNSPLSLAMAEE